MTVISHREHLQTPPERCPLEFPAHSAQAPALALVQRTGSRPRRPLVYMVVWRI